MTDPDGSEPSREDRPPLPRTPGSGTVRRLLLFVGLGGLVLGAAAVRHAVLLQDRIDPDLITTPDETLSDMLSYLELDATEQTVASMLRRLTPSLGPPVSSLSAWPASVE